MVFVYLILLATLPIFVHLFHNQLMVWILKFISTTAKSAISVLHTATTTGWYLPVSNALVSSGVYTCPAGK
jgi:hypothetical protein